MTQLARPCPLSRQCFGGLVGLTGICCVSPSHGMLGDRPQSHQRCLTPTRSTVPTARDLVNGAAVSPSNAPRREVNLYPLLLDFHDGALGQTASRRELSPGPLAALRSIRRRRTVRVLAGPVPQIGTDSAYLMGGLCAAQPVRCHEAAILCARPSLTSPDRLALRGVSCLSCRDHA